MYIRQYLLEDRTEEVKYYVVDDKNVPAPTLAKRRLMLLHSGVKLKPLSKAIFFLGDLVKIAKPKCWYIDSNGLIFNYKKSQTVKLVFRKIKATHIIRTGGAILEIEGIPSRFKCLYAPKPNEIYAGLLVSGLSYILYGVYETLHKDTRRKI